MSMTDYIIKIAETGTAFCYPTVPDSERVAYLQEKIKIDAKIEIKDQILMTKKGLRLKPEDVFEAIIEKENALSSTMNAGDGGAVVRSRPYFIIVVFNEKSMTRVDFPDRSQWVSTLMADDIDEEDYKNAIIEAKITDRDFSCRFQDERPDQKDHERLLNLYSDILAVESRLFSHYDQIKKRYVTYFHKLKKVERTSMEYENQIQSLEVILKQSSQQYQATKAKKNDLNKRMKDNIDKNTLTVRKFEDSIENLKKIPIHEKLKSDRVKVLLDIYYNPEQMTHWKNNCLNIQQNIKTRCDKITTYMKNLRKKIKEERNSTIANAVQQHSHHKSHFENNIHESQSIMSSIFISVYEDYRQFRKYIEVFLENNENPDALQFLSNVDQFYEKEKHFQEQINVSNDHIEKMSKLLEQIIKIKISKEQVVVQSFKVIQKYVAELVLISTDKMKHLGEEIDKMEKDFSYLLNPGNLPSAYNAALSEVSRRIEFSKIFDEKSRKLNQLIETEKEKRKKFLSNYGRILPSDFIPQLKNLTPIFTVTQNADSELPQIEGYNQGDRVRLDKGKNQLVKSCDELDQLERVNFELRHEISKLKEELGSGSKREAQHLLIRELEAEQKKVFSLQTRLNEYEKSKPKIQDDKKDAENVRLTKEIEELNKVLLQTQSLLQQDIKVSQDLKNGGILSDLDSNNPQYLNERLRGRVYATAELLQQTTGVCMALFTRKLSEKQKEVLRMKELLDECELTYSQKLQEKVNECRNLSSELNVLRTQHLEKQNKFNIELEKLRQESKAKDNLLRSKDEVNKSLTDIQKGLNSEIVELKQKNAENDAQIKSMHTEVLTNIHNANKTEVEKLRLRIRDLELELSNKKIEADKVTCQLSGLTREIKAKQEEYERILGANEQLTVGNQRLKEEVQKYANKSENLEIVANKRSVELNSINKTISHLTGEKDLLSTEISKLRESLGECQRKLQLAGEKTKTLETDRESWKAKSDKLALEVEKKTIEISNVKRIMEEHISEKKMNQEELDKLCVNRESEKQKIIELSDELNKKRVEVNDMSMKLEILQADLSNRNHEIAHMMESVKVLKEEKKQLEREFDEQANRGENKLKEFEKLTFKLKDLETINEQLLIESEIQSKRQEELESNIKQLRHELEDKVKQMGALEQRLNGLESELKSKRSREDELTRNLNDLKISNEQYKKMLNEKNEDNIQYNHDHEMVLEKIRKLEGELSFRSKQLGEQEVQMANLKDQLGKQSHLVDEMRNQENCYREEIEILRKENDQIKDLNMPEFKDNSSTMGDDSYKSWLQTADFKAEVLLKHSTINKSAKMTLHDLIKNYASYSDIVDYSRLEEGLKALFLPVAPGIYTPLILKQALPLNLNCDQTTSLVKSYKNNYFLDMNQFDAKYKDLLLECSLLLIAKVKTLSVKRVDNKDDNPFGLKKDEIYTIIKVEAPECIIGFEEEDYAIKNYV